MSKPDKDGPARRPARVSPTPNFTPPGGPPPPPPPPPPKENEFDPDP